MEVEAGIQMRRYAADLVFKVIEVPNGEEAPAVLDPRWKELRRHGLDFEGGNPEQTRVQMKWLIKSVEQTAAALTPEDVLEKDSP